MLEVSVFVVGQMKLELISCDPVQRQRQTEQNRAEENRREQTTITDPMQRQGNQSKPKKKTRLLIITHVEIHRCTGVDAMEDWFASIDLPSLSF